MTNYSYNTLGDDSRSRFQDGTVVPPWWKTPMEDDEDYFRPDGWKGLTRKEIDELFVKAC